MGRRIKDLFSFTRAEMRGVLWLLPLLAVLAAIVVFANRPRFEESFLEQVAERRAQADTAAHGWHGARDTVRYNGRVEAGRQAALSDFDPNALDAEDFVALGFSPRQAAAIIRYREARGGFRTADDLGRSYVVSDEMFARLRPYIRIASTGTMDAVDTGGAAAVNAAASAPRDPVTVDAPIVRMPVDLNTADSAELIAVIGIGNVLAVRIMDYRERLGGYAGVEQLREIPGMTEENYLRIIPQIFADSAEIRKIDINFASPQIVGRHPYVTSEMLRKLLKNRQLKGGWRSTGELVNENIITPEQAVRLGPYLVFN